MSANTSTELSQSTVYTGPDLVSSAMLYEVEKFTAMYTDLATELAAATGDRASAVKTWVESSTDTEAVKLREVIAKATAKLTELAEANVKDVSLSDDEVAKKREELKALKSAVRDKRVATSLIATTINKDTEAVLKALESIEDPTKGKGGAKAGTPGPKGPRVSATVKVVGFDNGPQNFDGLSKAATAIGIETKMLQEAYAKAAAVPFNNIAKVSKQLTFEVEGAGGKTFRLETTPKPRSNAVPKASPKDEAAKADDQEAEQVNDVTEE